MLFSKASGQLRQEILQQKTTLNILLGRIEDFRLTPFRAELMAGKEIIQPSTSFGYSISEASKVTANVGEDWLRFIQNIFYNTQSAKITYRLVDSDDEIVEATIIR